jgi:hypothetical protein
MSFAVVSIDRPDSDQSATCTVSRRPQPNAGPGAPAAPQICNRGIDPVKTFFPIAHGIVLAQLPARAGTGRGAPGQPRTELA